MLVVDASVALKWFIANEPDADRALSILEDGVSLAAPDLLIVEVCNAAWKSVRLGRILQAKADVIATDLPRFINRFETAAVLASRAVTIAASLDHPVYDAIYLALAEREATQMVTADSRLLAKVQGSAWEGSVMSLAAYEAST